ncbi:hypothetical protein G6F22_019506 [Rhizopus arrhizus]|nr:hypothetical protein G6F22_019506 [Rhizopus arrhizus]
MPGFRDGIGVGAAVQQNGLRHRTIRLAGRLRHARLRIEPRDRHRHYDRPVGHRRNRRRVVEDAGHRLRIQWRPCRAVAEDDVRHVQVPRHDIDGAGIGRNRVPFTHGHGLADVGRRGSCRLHPTGRPQHSQGQGEACVPCDHVGFPCAARCGVRVCHASIENDVRHAIVSSIS